MAEKESSPRPQPRARGRVIRVPDQLDLLGDLDHVYELALNAKRTYRDRHGGEVSYEQPDFKAAISAIRVKAEICGYIRNAPQFETDVLVADAMRRALSDPELRRMLVEQLKALEPGLLVESKESGG